MFRLVTLYSYLYFFAFKKTLCSLLETSRLDYAFLLQAADIYIEERVCFKKLLKEL